MSTSKKALIPESSPSQYKSTRAIESSRPGEIPELHKRIALRAYELFEERGRIPGHAEEDWLQAEQEITSERMDSDLG